ncbi:hypothetical protein BMW23_0774 [Bodo saltans virus]|jgi:hypothetical protein|uniref:Uncharacterized protein n=1 Tax=Bodo saltans virus TaxID=2024608 RepID=A0A2H4UV74_9VIRU|nr:hypothetical protein QJ851_gp0757 [Bodo saltans virus]ATZ80820.1 hypothetical protein BMW23_0774 [Bodo saltans virus]
MELNIDTLLEILTARNFRTNVLSTLNPRQLELLLRNPQDLIASNSRFRYDPQTGIISENGNPKYELDRASRNLITLYTSRVGFASEYSHPPGFIADNVRGAPMTNPPQVPAKYRNNPYNPITGIELTGGKLKKSSKESSKRSSKRTSKRTSKGKK